MLASEYCPTWTMAYVAVQELVEHEPVAEVRHPHRERGRHERDPELVHRPEELAVELEAELLAAVAEQRDVHDERSAEVPDDDPERAFLVDDDEDHRERDRDGDVQERRDGEGHRPLLDPEQVRHLGVVDVHPEQNGRRDHEARAAPLEVGAVVGDPQQGGDLRREQDGESHRQRRIGHLRPEDGADEAALVLGVLVQEVEADEAEVGAPPNHDDHHGHQRHEDLDAAVIARRDVARVERQHEDREEARHQPADAVDHRVAAELDQLGGQRLRLSVSGPRGAVRPGRRLQAHGADGSPLPGGPIRVGH